jgi:hypothetical protein
MLQAVLVFQLAVGMELPAAHASVSPGHERGSAGAKRCPEHASPGKGSMASDARAVLAAGSSVRVAFHHESPIKTHDCCRSVGCQCHCTYSSALATVVGAVVAWPHLLPPADVRVTTPRPGTLFRPPIA